MKWHRLFLVFAVQLGLTIPAPAGIFFKREHEKPTPAQRVPELIQTLKTETNDKKRESAAEELRQFDPKDFPEIVPALIDALQHDTKAEVRAEAAQTLGKLRPVTQEVGQALEQAVANDASHRVRWHARMILWSYSKSGFRSTAKPDGGPNLTPGSTTTKEPPLATPGPDPLPPVPLPPPTARPTTSSSNLRPVPRPTGGTPSPAPLPSTVPDEGPALTPP